MEVRGGDKAGLNRGIDRAAIRLTMIDESGSNVFARRSREISGENGDRTAPVMFRHLNGSTLPITSAHPWDTHGSRPATEAEPPGICPGRPRFYLTVGEDGGNGEPVPEAGEEEWGAVPDLPETGVLCTVLEREAASDGPVLNHHSVYGDRGGTLVIQAFYEFIADPGKFLLKTRTLCCSFRNVAREQLISPYTAEKDYRPAYRQEIGRTPAQEGVDHRIRYNHQLFDSMRTAEPVGIPKVDRSGPRAVHTKR
jgi:hypothetical protein